MSTFNQPAQQGPPPPQSGYAGMGAPAPGGKAAGYSSAAQQWNAGIYFQGKSTLPKWQTKLGQCDAPVTMNDWMWSIFCCHCAQAGAKSDMDGSSACFNFFCFGHIGAFSWIRRAYNLHGTCGDDICWGLLCVPCTVRQTVNEVRLQTAAGNNPPLLHGGPTDWQESLFGCGCCDFFKACLCPGRITHDVRRLLQPIDSKLQPDSCCFDCLCLSPTSVYGTVRHTYGIQNEFGLCEDLCLPLFCFPCALSRAQREAEWRTEQIRRLTQPQGVAGIAQGVAGAVGNAFRR